MRTDLADVDAAHSRRKDDAERVVADVRAIYAELASRAPARDCIRRTDCCRFVLTGRTPHLTRGEALVAARAFRASGRRQLPERTDGSCPLLDDQGRCVIYEDRPLGCRTHFCAAAGDVHPRRLVADLVDRLDEIDERLGGDGASALPTAVANALSDLRR